MKKTLLALLIFLSSLCIYAQNKKVAGFYPDYSTVGVNNVQYTKLTDIFYAFVFPNTTGVLYSKDGSYNDVVVNGAGSRVLSVMKPLAAKARASGVKIHLSVGGAGGSYGFSATMANAGYRSKMIDSLASLVARFDLDGVNIDWEFPSSGDKTNFETFMSALRTKLNTVGVSEGRTIELSIAVGVGLFDDGGYAVNSSIFNNVDYVYLMAFDAQGSCCVCDPNHHSTVTTAEYVIKKWSSGLTKPSPICGGDFTSKGVPTSKLVLGIPFYSDNGSGVNWDAISASNPATYYNDADGINGGYDYNSCAMIQSKTNLIMNTYNGAGIWCWDLDADREDQYSLLNCMYTAMQPYLCTATAPALGADVITCGTSVVLNSNITPGAGITYAWYKDDVLIGGATNSTYSTALAGKYKVVVTNNGCPKFDEVNVTVNALLATVGDTVCTTAELATIKVTTPGGPYNWYAASTGGSSLYTGSTYTTTVNATKDFYVEGLGGETKVLGPKYPLNDVTDQTYTKGWYANFATDGDSLSVDFDVNVTIDSILVYSDFTATNKNLLFSVYSKNNVLIGSKSYTVLAGTEKVLRVPIGISVPAGQGYKLTMRGSNHSFWYDAASATYPYTIAGLGKINYGLASWGPDNALYPGFYNLTLSTGSGSGGCGRQAVKVLLDPCTTVNNLEHDLAAIYPNPSSANFTIDLKEASEVRSVELYDVTGKMIQSLSFNGSKLVFGDDLKSGIYFVKINSISGTQNVQVIKN